jgi:hypothetical protein
MTDVTAYLKVLRPSEGVGEFYFELCRGGTRDDERTSHHRPKN